YDKDIDGVFVEGEAGFKEARDFMRMLMPSQAKKVQLHREPTPLFVKHRVEDHLSQIYSPVVPLRSGGYLVINQTEALVAVDVNSGRSTRERNIEATAMKTNMEAAEETARQLRLRDLAGLIVIDFIDMDEAKNNRAVEKKLKDCLKDDRARVQMGKISAFGLMEISRQRRRTGVLEGTTHVCEHCAGTGRVRSVESSALAALRTLELEALKGGGEATLTVPRAVGLYILNEKRAHLARLHQTLGLFVTVVIDDAMAHADVGIERTASETRAEHAPIPLAPVQAYEPSADEAFDDEAYEDEDEDDEEEDDEERPERPIAVSGPGSVTQAPRRHDDEDREEGEGGRRGGRRRRRRGRRGDEPREARDPAAVAANGAPPAPRPDDGHGDDEDGGQGRRRRRGRRGGRRMRDDTRPADAFAWTRPWVPYGDDPFVWYDPGEDLKKVAAPANDERPAQPTPQVAAEAAQPAPAVVSAPRADTADEEIWVELPAVEDRPKRPRRGRGGRGPRTEEAAEATVEAVAEPVPEPVPEPEPLPEPAAANADVPAKKPRGRSRKAAAPEPAEPVLETVEAASAPVIEAAPEPAPPPAPRAPDPAEISTPPAAPRKGWWRRG
ncbi:MAG: ribonuclease E/G, partial [Phenylobacterium sp.]